MPSCILSCFICFHSLTFFDFSVFYFAFYCKILREATCVSTLGATQIELLCLQCTGKEVNGPRGINTSCSKNERRHSALDELTCWKGLFFLQCACFCVKRCCCARNISLSPSLCLCRFFSPFASNHHPPPPPPPPLLTPLLSELCEEEKRGIQGLMYCST